MSNPLSNYSVRREKEQLKQRKFDILKELYDLSEEERMWIFSHFCKHSGCDNPKCQCWNDD